MKKQIYIRGTREQVPLEGPLSSFAPLARTLLGTTQLCFKHLNTAKHVLYLILCIHCVTSREGWHGVRTPPPEKKGSVPHCSDPLNGPILVEFGSTYQLKTRCQSWAPLKNSGSAHAEDRFYHYQQTAQILITVCPSTCSSGGSMVADQGIYMYKGVGIRLAVF